MWISTYGAAGRGNPRDNIIDVCIKCAKTRRNHGTANFDANGNNTKSGSFGPRCRKKWFRWLCISLSIECNFLIYVAHTCFLATFLHFPPCSNINETEPKPMQAQEMTLATSDCLNVAFTRRAEVSRTLDSHTALACADLDFCSCSFTSYSQFFNIHHMTATESQDEVSSPLYYY
jgi:hypothetical protein